MYKIARNLSVLGVGLSASAFVGWLLLRESKRGRDKAGGASAKQSYDYVEHLEAPEIVLPLETLEADEGSEPDDLTQIAGIGPRYANALRAAGVGSFKELAALTPEEIAQRLSPHVSVRPERIRNSAWIEQAAKLAKS
jgi:predicted flap endonuclease-1-like 5' DNA nuclease